MLDLYHLASSQGEVDRQVFIGVANQAGGIWSAQIWQKPRGVSMVHILSVDAGGGGGGGRSRIAGAAGGGGGGGGSGPTLTMLIPAYLLPDTLYMFVGIAGSGGAPDNNGGIPYPTIIYLGTAATSIGAGDILLSSGGLGTTSGGGGAPGGAGGVGGTGGDVDTTSLFQLGTSGKFTAIAGQNGALGGAQTGAVGVSITLPATGGVCTGGASGGGTTSADFAGGGFNASANSLLSDARPIAPAAGSTHGSGGPVLWKPFFTFGGCGGGSSNAGVGGNGGNAGYGSGGGGGGAGTTGGRGGDGGPGIVIITAW